MNLDLRSFLLDVSLGETIPIRPLVMIIAIIISFLISSPDSIDVWRLLRAIKEPEVTRRPYEQEIRLAGLAFHELSSHDMGDCLRTSRRLERVLHSQERRLVKEQR
jgi:hypothetical protein